MKTEHVTSAPPNTHDNGKLHPGRRCWALKCPARHALSALPLVLTGLLLSLALAGCASSPRFGTRDSGANGRGTPAQTASEAKPARPSTGRVLLTLEGVASYYAHEFHGKLTSNGETFDMYALTAAHRSFPFGTKVRVTNLENNLSVIVRINDRGPFKEGRIIDLSYGAARDINLIQSGTARVKLEVIEWGDGS